MKWGVGTGREGKGGGGGGDAKERIRGIQVIFKDTIIIVL